MISGGSMHCCIFKIIGFKLWLRTLGGTLRKRLRASQIRHHMPVTYEKPLLSNAKHLHLTFARPKTTTTPPPAAKVSTPMSASSTKTTIVAVILMIPCYNQLFSYDISPSESSFPWNFPAQSKGCFNSMFLL